MRLPFSFGALAAAGALSILSATSALAAENAPPNPANVQTIPITVKQEGPEDYPAGAAAKGEEGTTLLMITFGNGTLGAKQMISSGHPDLDAAATDVAITAYKASATPNVKFVAVIWSLKPKIGAPSQTQSPSGP